MAEGAGAAGATSVVLGVVSGPTGQCGAPHAHLVPPFHSPNPFPKPRKWHVWQPPVTTRGRAKKAQSASSTGSLEADRVQTRCGGLGGDECAVLGSLCARHWAAVDHSPGVGAAPRPHDATESELPDLSHPPLAAQGHHPLSSGLPNCPPPSTPGPTIGSLCIHKDLPKRQG